MASVVIFGSGAGADTAFRYLSKDSPHDVVAFTVDAEYLTIDRFHDRPVVPFDSLKVSYPPDQVQCLVPLGFQGMNRVRTDKFLQVQQQGYRCISYLNTSHYSLDPLAVGQNCFILDSQTFNLDVTIGDNVMMWSGNHIGDRVKIGSHTWVSSHVTVAGDAEVGEACFLGINASVGNGVRLGARTFVGAGVTITKDTAEGSVHVAAASRTVAMASDRFVGMLTKGGGL